MNFIVMGFLPIDNMHFKMYFYCIFINKHYQAINLVYELALCGLNKHLIVDKNVFRII